VHQQHEDLFGNRVDYIGIQQSHRELTVESLSEVELQGRTLPEPAQDSP